jgi:hypothetical protein
MIIPVVKEDRYKGRDKKNPNGVESLQPGVASLRATLGRREPDNFLFLFTTLKGLKPHGERITRAATLSGLKMFCFARFPRVGRRRPTLGWRLTTPLG